MPNGGIHHCGRCIHHEMMHCKLRNIELLKSFWTTCDNWNQQTTSSTGPVYSIISEVKNKKGYYVTIPYFKGNRVDTYQIDEGDTVIYFNDGSGNFIELPDAESYLKFYAENSK